MLSGEKLSQLWEKPLHSYHEELGGEDNFRTLFKTNSLDELLDNKHILGPFGPQSRKALDTINRLKPVIMTLNDLSAVLAVSIGAGTAVKALIWGSVRNILTVGSCVPSDDDP